MSMECGAGTILRNALIIDGTGAPSFPGDVVVSGDTIVAVSQAKKPDAITQAIPLVGMTEIDCTGLTLTPGFIDIHNHSDTAVFQEPSARNYITQGLTTILVGHCGSSAAPTAPDMLLSVGEERHLAPWRTFQEYFRALDDLEMSVNVAPLIGHSQVRRVVIGSDDREPTLAQMDVMRGYVAEAMQAGAFGLSTGLIYAPGIYAKTPEISELARVAGQYGGLYATHLRSEADLMVDALMEAMTVGRESGLRVQVAHHKASGRRNWGLVKTTLDIMEYSRKLGVEVTCDVYPYTPSGAGIYSLMPAWARVRGVSGIKEFVSNPATRERIRKELARPSLTWENILFDAGFDEIFVTRSEVCPQYEGKTLAGIAREQSKDPMDLLLEIAETDVNIGMMAGGMSEDDMQYVLRHRLSMVCSDSRAVPFGVGCPHPRNYAAFTRAFATYARDQASLRVEEAVYKMSGFPAWKLGLHDRGVIRPGAKADIAVFDYWAVNSQSTFGDPHHYSDGTVHVMVNGRLVIKDGQVTPALPGRALRRPC